MYAVIQSSGRQYRVQPGEVIDVDRLPLQAGEEVVFDRVLLAADNRGVRVGSPVVPGAKVVGRVIDNYRARKVRVLKFKAKEHYRRLSSQRRAFTRIRIDSIVV
ncbi:MAG: 50S ribosomal protein L21 [Anaerolineae bacterium]